ncbi:MAG: TrmH family RNA methyltransferase [Bacteroidota bacterium]
MESRPAHASSALRKLRMDEIERPSADELAALPRHPIVVVLDHVRSAHNVGSILRTSDAARAAHVYLTGITPTPDHRAVTKASLGAEDSVPWSHHSDILALMDELRAAGSFLLALEQTATATSLSAITVQHAPVALIVGNEVEGVQQAVLDRCDAALELPQYGTKHSLNVSVASGIALYGLLDRLGIAS